MDAVGHFSVRAAATASRLGSKRKHTQAQQASNLALLFASFGNVLNKGVRDKASPRLSPADLSFAPELALRGLTTLLGLLDNDMLDYPGDYPLYWIEFQYFSTVN